MPSADTVPTSADVFLLDQVVELDPGEELTAAMLPFPEDRTKFVFGCPASKKTMQIMGLVIH